MSLNDRTLPSNARNGLDLNPTPGPTTATVSSSSSTFDRPSSRATEFSNPTALKSSSKPSTPATSISDVSATMKSAVAEPIREEDEINPVSSLDQDENQSSELRPDDDENSQEGGKLLDEEEDEEGLLDEDGDDEDVLLKHQLKLEQERKEQQIKQSQQQQQQLQQQQTSSKPQNQSASLKANSSNANANNLKASTSSSAISDLDPDGGGSSGGPSQQLETAEVQLNVDEQAAAEDEDARDRETRMQAELQRINRKKDIRPANPNAARQSGFLDRVLDWFNWPSAVSFRELGLTDEDIENIKMISPFSSTELNKLCQMFLELDWDRRGYITFDEFLSLPSFAHCPFEEQLARVLDTDKQTHRMTFMGFIEALAVFSENTPKEQKIRFMFKLFDANNDGRLGRDELRQVLLALLPPTFESRLIDKLVDRVLSECSNRNDAVLEESIDYREFYQCLATSDIDSKLRIRI